MAVWLQAVLTGLWGGALALERRAFLQAMVSRPLVAGAGLGALLNDVRTGLYVGVVFELLHLGGVSLGGTHADHETLPTVTATGMAAAMGVSTSSPAQPALWAVAILVFAPAGALGRRLEVRLDQRARTYMGRAIDAAGEGDSRKAGRQNVRAMWPVFALYGALSAAAVGLGTLVGPLVERLPTQVLTGLAWAYPAMGTVAAAIAVHGTRARGGARLAGAAALVVFAGLYVWNWSRA